MVTNFLLRLFVIIADFCQRLRSSSNQEKYSATTPLPVETPFGTLVGTHNINACDVWLGVPYANPPIGDLRFAGTVAWNQIYDKGRWDATKSSAFCLQKAGGSEDCLYLNVWRPTTRNADHSIPVMVFIHGGSFTSGSAINAAPGKMPDSMGLYDGCNLSKEQGVIVASMNYRLGPLGFAVFEEEGSAANFGLQDQRVAIQWLKDQVALFGGDPNAITIFGESAGAMSVLAHVASPKSKGLFRAAISESGYPIALSWVQGLDMTRQYATKVGCNEQASLRSCLRSKTSKQLLKAAEDSIDPTQFLVQTGWNPVVDGSELPQHPLKALSSNDDPDPIPLLIGTNTDEANMFLYQNYRFGMKFGQFENWLQHFTNNHNVETKFNSTLIKEANALYANIKGKRSRASAIGTDGSFLCGTQAIAQAYQRADVFVYRFNHRPACFPLNIMLGPGISHTLELLFVFGNPDHWFCKFDTVDAAVGLRIRTMWANFAKSRNPSEPGIFPNATIPIFPQYTNHDRRDLVIQGDGDGMESKYRDTYCEFWQDKIFNKLIIHHMGPEKNNSSVNFRDELQIV